MPPYSWIFFIAKSFENLIPIRFRQVNGLNWSLIGLIEFFYYHGINFSNLKAVGTLPVLSERWE